MMYIDIPKEKWLNYLGPVIFMPPHQMMPGAYSFSVFYTWVHVYIGSG